MSKTGRSERVSNELENVLQSVDPLGEALHSLRMSGTFYSRSDLTAPWGIDLPAMPESLMFHVVVRGDCWITFPNGDQRRLEQGDFALIPHGQGHSVTDDPATEAINIFELERELVSPRYELLEIDGGGAPATIICGAVSVKDPAAQRVVSLLPKIIVMETHSPDNSWLLDTIRMMASEAQSLKAGGDTIITRVSDILVVQTIRHWLDTDPLARTGWLGALQDPQIGRAVACIHRHPTSVSSVDMLAEIAGMSRSGFYAHFVELVGEPPMQYVRKWRFQIATGWLQDTDMRIAEMAEQLGYESEASFSRAYKKQTGVSPGAVRKKLPL